MEKDRPDKQQYGDKKEQILLDWTYTPQGWQWALQGSSAIESRRYKRKGKAKKLMATNYTERMWEA
jgi:hypothetical protein